MANLTTTGTTGYPGAIDTRTSLTDGSAGDTIVANHPNGLGAAVLAIENELGLNPSGTLADLVTRLNITTNSDGTLRDVIFSVGDVQNIGLTVTNDSPVGNAMTITLNGQDGTALSSTNTARIVFRNGTATTGQYVARSLTANISVSISSGSTLGFTGDERGFIYIYTIDNAGTVELAVTKRAIFNESRLWTTTAEGGSGTADDGFTLYSTSARSNVAVHCIGIMEIQTENTPGQWSNVPTYLALIGPGSKITGDVIQQIATVTATGSSGTVVIPFDATVPLITEGNQFLYLPITTTFESNIVEVEVMGDVSNGNTGQIAGALFRATGTSAVAAVVNFGSSDEPSELYIKFSTVSGTASSITWSARFGAAAAGTTRLNGISTQDPFYNNKTGSYMIIREIQA